MSTKYSNDTLIDTVDHIRELNGQKPVTFRGIRKKTVLAFRTQDKTEVFYSAGELINFLDNVKEIDPELYERLTNPS